MNMKAEASMTSKRPPDKAPGSKQCSPRLQQPTGPGLRAWGRVGSFNKDTYRMPSGV